MAHFARGFVVALMLLSALLCLPARGETLPELSARYAAPRSGVDPLGGAESAPPNFQRHVVPLLGRLGCNGRSCHGSFQGRGGFRLSMFGYDFSEDHAALAGGSAARVDVRHPPASLILNKPTSDDDHGGGQRFETGGWEYRVLLAWIAGGAPNNSSEAGLLERLEVTPAEIVFGAAENTARLRTVAVWSDGTREDVTCLTRFSSNNDIVAEVDEHGVVRAKAAGDASIIASYDSGVVAVPVMLAVSAQVGERYPAIEAPTPIDQRIAARLRKLGIVPAERCGDAEFLRRVSLDITGTLPTPEEVAAFLADPALDKRQRKIDELLDSPAYAVWWTTWFCDITGLNAPLYLGSTDFGPIVGEQWRSWMERKIRDNTAYDKIVEGMVVAVSREPGQNYLEYALAQSSYTRSRDAADYTARETMPHFWFRGNLGTADDKALAFAYSFLGVRLDCAQCHKHPFDRWSQQDFRQFAKLFEPIGWGVSAECLEDYNALKEELGVPAMKNAAERRQTYWRWAREGRAVPWPEVYVDRGEGGMRRGQRDPTLANVPAKLLGGAELDLTATDDPRRELMHWLREPDHPYFGRSLVNRVWAAYMGRGMVEPADDLSQGNPPTNPELLDYLTQAFVEHRYDLKWLHREITNSLAYQRSWQPNDTNRGDTRQFSRATIRRLPAEVAVDALYLATASTRETARLRDRPHERRIAAQAAAYPVKTEFPLVVFGKPLRTINCDCEREQAPSLSQAIFLRNDEEVLTLLDRPAGWLAELKKLPADHATRQADVLVEQAYLRVLSRKPQVDERQRAIEHLHAAGDTVDALGDLLWALLNTDEFITNH